MADCCGWERCWGKIIIFVKSVNFTVVCFCTTWNTYNSCWSGVKNWFLFLMTVLQVMTVPILRHVLPKYKMRFLNWCKCEFTIFKRFFYYSFVIRCALVWFSPLVGCGFDALSFCTLLVNANKSKLIILLLTKGRCVWLAPCLLILESVGAHRASFPKSKWGLPGDFYAVKVLIAFNFTRCWQWAWLITQWQV